MNTGLLVRSMELAARADSGTPDSGSGLGIENVNAASLGNAATAARGLNSTAATLSLVVAESGAVPVERVDVDAARVVEPPPGTQGSAFALRGWPKTNGLANGLRDSRRADDDTACSACGTWCGIGGEIRPKADVWPNDEDECC